MADGAGPEESGSGEEQPAEDQRRGWRSFIGNTSSQRVTETAQSVEDFDVEIIEDLTCEVCGKPLEYAGRGRKPKYCDEHKSGRSTAAKPRGATKGKTDAKSRSLTDGLADNARILALGIGAAMPTTGFVIMEDSDQFAAAVVRLFRNNPRAMKVLEKASQASPAFQVGKTLARIGTAVNVDTGRFKPDVGVSQALGVFKAWQETHPGQSPNFDGHTYTVPPAPTVAYVPVP